MTHDEAFIRAIVDRPGDESLRLVYADWLEDRGDPRATYLRAEREAFRTGETIELREVAVELDPVWVARVTLPPLGCYCDNIQVRERGVRITTGDIDEFEHKFKLCLPHDYRAFLLNYNGGVIGRYVYEMPDGNPIDWSLDYTFYSLTPASHEADNNGLQSQIPWRDRILDRDDADTPLDPLVREWFLDFIDVGRTPDMIYGLLLGIGDHTFGEVRYFDYSVGFYPHFLDDIGEPYARSFSELLSLL